MWMPHARRRGTMETTIRPGATVTAHEQDDDARLGRAVARGILFGLPIAYVLLVLGLWLLFDRDLTTALQTSALPGLLLGVFFGGFFGVTRATD
jgi:hypothetical protein